MRIAQLVYKLKTTKKKKKKKKKGANYKYLRTTNSRHTSTNVKTVLDQKDDEGNTVLHITVSKDETQIVSHLLAWGSKFVDVNSTNSEGKTAWDILQGQTQVNSREIGLMLHSNTVLHILALKNDTKAVTHLLCKCVQFMDVNHKNLEGQTAWDILREDNREISLDHNRFSKTDDSVSVCCEHLLYCNAAVILEEMIRLSAIPQQHTKQRQPLLWKESLF
ncbi:hypothetical protein CMV_019835 [Castanea mollissima]|uniref:Uncharacterized protein n=1 Tax=Castanea mollissima TaxID=60419 RepID=A0A8J4QZM1_9ROSI|nr:hypothetical protein CMV_019835 [Castanea mollissima]